MRRTCDVGCEAVALREEASKSTGGALRGRGPSAHTRIAEIMPGRAIFQQGLVTTCKDLTQQLNRRREEEFGLTHEPV